MSNVKLQPYESDKEKIERIAHEVFNPPASHRPYFEGYAPKFYFQTDANTDDWWSSETHYRVGQMGG